MADFSHLVPGDVVIRNLGGSKMRMVVREIQGDLLVCDTESGFRGGWTFDRKTGAEEDADLQWGVKFGRTGSYLIDDPTIE